MKKITLTLAAVLAGACAFAQTVINFQDFAAKMGGETDAKIVLDKILQDNAGKEALTVTFPKGRYDFFPSKYTQDGPYEAAITVDGFKGLTIDGGGSEFICHGMMEIANLRNSEGVTLRNFSVDWERPLMTQCTVVKVTDDYMDVAIDADQYPYMIEDGKILFTGEGWAFPMNPASYNNVYTPDGEIAYNTWDSAITSAICKARVEQLGDGNVRFYYHHSYMPEPGYIFTLYHKRYAVNGIDVKRCKDTVFEDLTLYHSLSHGFVCILCENVTQTRVKLIPNKEKGRVFSSVADGTHFLNCKGTMTFRGCEYAGQGDDFLNIHGRNSKIAGTSGKTITLVDKGQTELFNPGDTIACVGRVSGQRDFILTVKESENGVVTFNETVPSTVVSGEYVLENMTWTAGLVYENNIVTKCNRARGILITTPKPSIVRNNVFHSAGTAILIEGDTDVWFESGACGDLTITGNVFDNCLTSGNRDGDRWQWGDAIITITPTHRPADAEAPSFHRNIKICDNEFRVFDVPLVRGCSVDGLTFKGNRIIKTYDYKPYTYYKDSFVLEGCRNVNISGNRIDPAYKTRTVKATLMKASDIKARKFKVNVSEEK